MSVNVPIPMMCSNALVEAHCVAILDIDTGGVGTYLL